MVHIDRYSRRMGRRKNYERRRFRIDRESGTLYNRRSIGGLVVQSAGYLFDRWDYRQSGCGYDRGDRFAMDCVSFQRTEA